MYSTTVFRVDSTNEERWGGPNAQRFAFAPISIDCIRILAAIDAIHENAPIRTELSRVTGHVPDRQFALIAEKAVVRLPEFPLILCAERGLSGLFCKWVSLVQRKISDNVPHLAGPDIVSDNTPQRLTRVGTAERALEIGKFDDRNWSVVISKRRLAGNVEVDTVQRRLLPAQNILQALEILLDVLLYRLYFFDVASERGLCLSCRHSPLRCWRE